MMKNLINLLRSTLPRPVKIILHPLLKLFRTIRFLIRYKFLPPPQGTDLVGYESLISFIEAHKLLEIDGDIVEIGAFLRGGTYKLAKYLKRKGSQKRIYAVDIFDIYTDQTECIQGIHMADIYERVVKTIGKGLSQWEIFQKVTKGCENIVVIKGDSKTIELPTSSVCFACIDGNHQPSYVRNDFYLVWSKLSPGGVVAFDDYGYDLPGVTVTINELIGECKQEITVISRQGKIIFLQKQNRGNG